MFYLKKINLTSINLVVMKEEFEIYCVLFFIRWTNIGLLLPGRTHKDVMNYCKTSYMRNKMSNRGVDLLLISDREGSHQLPHHLLLLLKRKTSFKKSLRPKFRRTNWMEKRAGNWIFISR